MLQRAVSVLLQAVEFGDGVIGEQRSRYCARSTTATGSSGRCLFERRPASPDAQRSTQAVVRLRSIVADPASQKRGISPGAAG